jgi:DNA-directed RNA polymerase subunit RPC12/RpoP
MTLKKPASMEECVYFTNRVIGSGKAIAWVFRKQCPKCKKDALRKPSTKSGKPDKKSPIYVCKNCRYEEKNEEAEKDLILNIEYKCPHCGNEGETTSEYKRKIFEGVPSYVFECQKCHKKIGLTKKLKDTKRRESKGDIDE